MMRSLVLLSALGTEEKNAFQHSAAIHGIPFHFGLLATERPEFPSDADAAYQVLVKKRAISINFRDLSILFTLNNGLSNNPGGYNCFGSDFVGEVVAVGRKVKNLKVGDRVIPNCDYEMKPKRGISMRGIPSNRASAAYDFFAAEKLLKIDDSITDEVAACMSIGLQTSYSMIRKAKIRKGERILVTSGSSNTSLFLIEALKAKGHRVTVLTSNPVTQERLGKEQEVILYQNTNDLTAQLDLHKSKYSSGFDVVFDPFSDVFFEKLIDYLNADARYLTCGLYKQKPEFKDLAESSIVSKPPLGYLLAHLIMKNIRLIGNCLGTTKDLVEAIADYKEGKINIAIDAVFSERELGSFIDKAFTDKRRSGKVVLTYY
ncbi:NADPH:quinone reductase [Pedobacter steynii]|uniref:NADPH:quinone reductase n=1 Tax=Pedobacter steynii TaxID=430522 RepID=A0A1G9JBM1_9SPHI|nr:zinc-binding alcohol dehydrogenase family protein [Pedobacter steynii]NQX38206.1 zinc-binding alcohol dehydrogenase family protein [Pedobacter steynii]SDL34979.1 NADPH:quinone reductase [Pedobacter steynii]